MDGGGSLDADEIKDALRVLVDESTQVKNKIKLLRTELAEKEKVAKVTQAAWRQERAAEEAAKAEEAERRAEQAEANLAAAAEAKAAKLAASEAKRAARAAEKADFEKRIAAKRK